MLKSIRTLARKGFTLIELLIVIVILAVLAVIVVISVSGLTSKGVKAACQSDAKTVEVAQESADAQNNAFQADTAGLVSAGFLREAPNSPYYQITTDTTGTIYVAVDPTGKSAYGTAVNFDTETASTGCNALS